VTAPARAIESRSGPTAARPPRQGLSYRLFTGLVPKFTFFVSLLLVGFAITQTSLSIIAQERTIEEQLRHRGAAMIAMLARIAAWPTTDEADVRELQSIVADLGRREDILYVRVIDWDGSLIAGSSSETEPQPGLADDALSRHARLQGELLTKIDGDGLHLAMPVRFGPDLVGAVRLGLSPRNMLDDLAAMRSRNLTLVVWFVAGSLVLTFAVVRRITRPLTQLIASTEAVSLGRMDTRISVSGSDELRLLAESFNRMLDRLETTTVSRDYVANILQSMSEALAVLTPDGRIALANRALCRLLGYSERELRGMLFDRLLSTAAAGVTSADLIGRLQREGALDRVEAEYLARSGQPIAVLVSGALMGEPAGPVRAMICVAQDNRERKLQEERIRQLAFFDTVTGLPNRVRFRQALEEAVADARQVGTRLAVLFLDLDRFKRINDTLGHASGDRLLEIFAQRLAGCLRSGDTIARLALPTDSSTVARLGGDEFTVLLRYVENRDDAAHIARRILTALGKPFQLAGHEVVVEASMGIALCPDDAADADALLMCADTAMYHAKAQGRANFQFYHPDLNAKALERLQLEAQLRKAVESDQLRLEFQPQIALATDRVIGAEALLRWCHPERGRLLPDDFVPLAEESGLIKPIGAWVLREACAQGRTWLDAGLGPLQLAVNISSRQLAQEDFLEQVAGALADAGFPGELLELEITESTAMAEPETTIATLSALKTLGVRIAIDDFGTGYSSLSYLRRFPLDRVKIDRSFTQGMTRDASNAGIVAAIIAMAHQLRFKVIAEGVEDEEQVAFLRAQGCEEIQGFLISPPREPADFRAWLAARR
jgi:diguanylate cyclase (GGDEF)-like protein/PAS domain S-box-containing protein